MSTRASVFHSRDYQHEIPLVKVYVWQWPVRITHWLIAISIWVLSVTGVYMGYPSLAAPGEATQLFIMGYAKVIHFYTAIVFTLAVIARIVWAFIGNRYANWRNFIPVEKVRRKGFGPTLRYYLFQLRLPPGFVGHNPLAGLTYFFVFLAYLVMILTGLGMYAVSAHYDSPMRIFAGVLPLFGGLATARLIHHVVMWGIWMFFVHHVYSAILMSQVEATATMESIFSGFKFVPKDDVTKPGHRFYQECAGVPSWRRPKPSKEEPAESPAREEAT